MKLLPAFLCVATLLLAGADARAAVAGASVAAEENWSQARNHDGIRVWTREVPGYPIRAFKATTIVKSTLGGLVTLVLDTPRAGEWIYRTDRVDVLRRNDEKASFVVRIITDFPWPLRDRDVIVEGIIHQEEGGTVSIISRTVPREFYSEDPDYMRMPDFEGLWTFKPLGKGLVEVTMQGRADPGGSIPASVINLIVHETPYQTMRGLRRMLEDKRYNAATLPQIREVQIKEAQP